MFRDFITEVYNVTVNNEELIGTTKCLTYRRGVVQIDVVITGFNCSSNNSLYRSTLK